MVRINKYLAECNLGSRRSVEELILSGLVEVNDTICKDLSMQINPDTDRVTLNGKVVKSKKQNIYIMLNKPPKYVVTKKDEFNRKTIFELLPKFKSNINPVGRLDYDSEGLIILTDDGDFANSMIHPKSKVPKVYKVTVTGKVNSESLKSLQEGVEIDKVKTLPAKVFVKDRSNVGTTLRITIYEGRNRQIRKMCEAVNLKVMKLKRLQIGELKLGKIPVGMWRELTQREINLFKKRQRQQ